MANLPAPDGEGRNLIDGRLVPASSGATFDNVNPATEEVLGVCADGTKEDMDAAIAAARRAFDETGWSEDHAFRKQCLTQLCEAMQEAKEQFRSIVVSEAGSPLLLTYSVQTDSSIDDLAALTPDLRSLGWSDELDAWAEGVEADGPSTKGRLARVTSGFSLVFTGGDALLAESAGARAVTTEPATGDFVVVGGSSRLSTGTRSPSHE